MADRLHAQLSGAPPDAGGKGQRCSRSARRLCAAPGSAGGCRCRRSPPCPRRRRYCGPASYVARKFDASTRQVLDDQPCGMDRRRFGILVIDADVADVRIGQRDDLPAVARVGQDLLVAGERGVEHHLADRAAGGADRTGPGTCVPSASARSAGGRRGSKTGEGSGSSVSRAQLRSPPLKAEKEPEREVRRGESVGKQRSFARRGWWQVNRRSIAGRVVPHVRRQAGWGASGPTSAAIPARADLRVLGRLDAADADRSDALPIPRSIGTPPSSMPSSPGALRNEYAPLVDHRPRRPCSRAGPARRCVPWRARSAAEIGAAPSRRCSHSRWPPSSTIAIVTASRRLFVSASASAAAAGDGAHVAQGQAGFGVHDERLQYSKVPSNVNWRPEAADRFRH